MDCWNSIKPYGCGGPDYGNRWFGLDMGGCEVGGARGEESIRESRWDKEGSSGSPRRINQLDLCSPQLRHFVDPRKPSLLLAS